MQLYRSSSHLLLAAFGLPLLACSNAVSGGPDTGAFCDDVPCDWTVAEGKVSPAPTWHEKAIGISMDTQGTRLVRDDLYLGGCKRLRIVADVGEDADLVLEVDDDLDGTVDATFGLPEGRYTPYVTGWPAGAWRSPELTLHKRGPGHVVLASFEVEPMPCPDDVDTWEPDWEPVPGPLGSTCRADAECAEGTCALTELPHTSSLNSKFDVTEEIGLCSDCAAQGQCAFDALCDQHSHCATDVCINGRCGCAEDADCGDGLVCTRGLCSSCRDDADCDSGERCASPASPIAQPRQCVPADDVANKRTVATVCDDTEQCLGLPCDGPTNLPARCGTACRLGEADDCPDGERCVILQTFSVTEEDENLVSSLGDGRRPRLPQDLAYTTGYLYLAQPAVCVPE